MFTRTTVSLLLFICCHSQSSSSREVETSWVLSTLFATAATFVFFKALQKLQSVPTHLWIAANKQKCKKEVPKCIINASANASARCDCNHGTIQSLSSSFFLITAFSGCFDLCSLKLLAASQRVVSLFSLFTHYLTVAYTVCPFILLP